MSKRAVTVGMVLILLVAPVTGALGASLEGPTNRTVSNGIAQNPAENISVWERAPLPFRADTEDAATTVDNQRMWINSPDGESVDANRDKLAVFNTGTISFDQKKVSGASTDEFANEDVQVIIGKVSPNALITDIDMLTSLRGEEMNALNDNVTFEHVVNTSLSQNGELFDVEYNADEPGQYVAFIATVDDGPGFVIDDGDIDVQGHSTVIGVEGVSVQQSESDVTGPEAVSAGENISFTANTGFGDSVHHVIAVYDEGSFTADGEETVLNITDEVDSDFSTEDIIVEQTTSGVDGVAKTKGDVEVRGTPIGDRRVVGLTTAADLISVMANETDRDTIEHKVTGDTVLNASVTGIAGGEPNTELTVETLDSWKEGEYRWVHIASKNATDEFETSTGTISVGQHYTLTVTVEDEDGNPLEDAAVTVDGTEEETDENGVATIELPNGDYTVTANQEGYDSTETDVTIDGNDESVTLTLTESKSGGGSPPGGPSPDPSPGGPSPGDPLEASFQVSNTTLSTVKPTIGEAVDIGATIENDGNAEGTFTANLTVDGTAVETMNVTLEPGESNQIIFTRTFEKVGDYTLGISGTEIGTISVSPTQAFEVSDPQLSTTKLMVGDELDVSATVTNIGKEEGKFTAELRIDGDVVERQKATLASDESERIEFTQTFEKPGIYSIAINDAEVGTVTVSPSLQLSETTLSATEIEASEAVEITATINNAGKLDGTFTANLVVDGDIVDTQDIAVAAETSETITFTRTFDTPGEYELRVNDQDVGTITVTEAQPGEASFEVTATTITPSTIKAGESVNITSTITNTGDAKETGVVEITANGEVIDTREVTLSPGESKTVTVTRNFNTSGDYQLTVNGVEVGSLTVSDSDSSRPLWHWLLSIITVLLLSAGAAYYWFQPDIQFPDR